MDIGKPLDSRVDDTLSSTSSLPEGDIRALIKIWKVATTTKSWAKDNISKVKIFLQHTMGIYERVLKTKKAIRECLENWEVRIKDSTK